MPKSISQQFTHVLVRSTMNSSNHTLPYGQMHPTLPPMPSQPIQFMTHVPTALTVGSMTVMVQSTIVYGMLLQTDIVLSMVILDMVVHLQMKRVVYVVVGWRLQERLLLLQSQLLRRRLDRLGIEPPTVPKTVGWEVPSLLLLPRIEHLEPVVVATDQVNADQMLLEASVRLEGAGVGMAWILDFVSDPHNHWNCPPVVSIKVKLR